MNLLHRSILSLSFLLALTANAAAHSSSVVYSEIVVDGRDVDYTFQIASSDLYEAIGVDRDRPVEKDEVTRGRDQLDRYLMQRVHVRSGGHECSAEPAGLSFIDNAQGFFTVDKLVYHCAREVTQAEVQYDLFFDVDPRHQGIARIAFGDEEGREQVFRQDQRTIAIKRDLTVLDHVRDYLLLGVEHIFTGYDHIAFLFGLLIICGASGLRRGAREVLKVVTAFTLAHSVTLVSSALGWIALPSRIVEPAIALSIAYVGLENLLNPSLEKHWIQPVARALGAIFGERVGGFLSRAARGSRWQLTFAFGLVHGFGFASALRELGLPEKGLLLSLVSFNVGVEIGQLAVVALVLPALALVIRKDVAPALLGAAILVGAGGSYLLFHHFGVPAPQLAAVCFGAAPAIILLGRRYGYDAVVRVGGSMIITLLAVFWFFERVLGRVWLGGQLG